MLGTTSIRTVFSSGNPEIDSLLVGTRWAGSDFFSQAVELWYAFPSRRVSFTDYGSNEDLGELESFSAVTAAQQTAIRASFNMISSYTLLTFKQDPFYSPTMTANDTTHSELLFGRTYATDTAHAYTPDTPDDKSGDVWFSRSGIYDEPVRGDYAFITVLHEVGHAVGLKHPHEAEAFGAMSLALDNMNYTLMSYRSYEGMDIGWGLANEEFGFPQTYMMYDIAALQHMYGANFSTNSWDNVYRWDPATGAATSNGAAWITPGANRVFMTVWDGGGIDTYDLSAYADAVEIDLNPGAWTQTSAVQLANLGDGRYAEGNIATALLYKGDARSLIENAVGGSGDDLIVGNQAANALTGNDGNDVLEGRLGIDTLVGGGGHDQLRGGAGADMMRGGAGDDQYEVDDQGDAIVELAAEGYDIVGSTAASYALSDHVEELVGLSTTSGQRLTGNALANVISARNGMGGNVLDGGAGADRMTGNILDDTYVVDNAGDFIHDDGGNDTVESSVSFGLAAPLENLILTGTAAIDGTGNWAANNLTGNSGANRLNGGGGADRMAGGAGNDVYDIDHVGDLVVEFLNEGIDRVEIALMSYTLGDHVENLTLGGLDAIDGTGNALSNLLVGNGAANVLRGGAGSDTIEAGAGNDTLDGGSEADILRGGAGDDLFIVDNSADSVVEASGAGTDSVQSSASFTLGANVEKLTLVGEAAVNGTGNALANSLTGNGAANRLDGGLAADSMTGGLGDDVYAVDHVGDKIVELAGGGTDTVESVLSFTLAADLEHLTLAGTAAISGTGNDGANILTGNSAANTLSGGVGADVMRGAAGDDIYLVDDIGDQVEETAAGNGKDQVRSSVSFTLGAFVEKLSLTGTAAVDGTGNALANSINGNTAANILDGGAGADALAGGAGNDTYIVDNLGDRASETAAGDGVDTVMSSVGFSLTAHLENLVLTGAAAINATGNSLANAITGNAGANLLNGGGGADAMAGGGGNDSYIVDHSGDTVTELAGGGTDLVKSTVTFTLGAEVEKLTLRGASAIDGTGNALANTLVGNEAANRLDGGTGADKLYGYGGNDTYVIDNIADQAIEVSSGGGTDRVESSVTFTLGDNIEALTLTGSGAVNGTGNDLANTLTGNAAANVLDGGRGNDGLVGGGGDDRLVGGLGNDSLQGDSGADDFVFDKALGPTNVDHILDFAAGTDSILLENSVFKGLAAGALGAGALRIGSASADADDRIVYDPTTGNLYFDSDGIGAASQVLFATLDTRPTLTASDFAVI